MGELGYLHAKAFACRVGEELQRSERYNHFFTVIVFQIAGGGCDSFLRAIKDNLRFSDLTVQIPPGYAGRPKSRESVKQNEIGIILPETGPEGAKYVFEKLKWAVNCDRTKCGYAIFPDDSRNPHNLLELARERAGRMEENTLPGSACF